ncbi:Delta-1-pyrroline-5-carboxylate synthetase [Phytophthora palmivora]|uniref:Delta-1-pyrroline-5-carboxylate synthetase n=1 Tax=Phytophthora palmivora TaxID=4796 RepID=A0A2P4YJQ1_9STRA|nr:Delta-1-pyrroline-5-carboxylate synthetase [Phytophthora palmivora]
MGQIGNIVEQLAMLHMRGHNTIFVSSGSITIGKMVLHRQISAVRPHLGGQVDDNVQFNEKVCATGQRGLQSLYEMLFAHYQLNCSQVLASDADFREPRVQENLMDGEEVGELLVIVGKSGASRPIDRSWTSESFR